jgi:uncharacterized membrane protein YeiH
MILHEDIYASAVLAAGIVLIVSRRWGLSATTAALLGGSACFMLRMASVALSTAAVAYG